MKQSLFVRVGMRMIESKHQFRILLRLNHVNIISKSFGNNSLYKFMLTM